MKPKGSTPIRASGQRSILSTFNHQYAQPCGLEGCKREHIIYPRAFAKETHYDAKASYKTVSFKGSIIALVLNYSFLEFVQLDNFYNIFTAVIKDDKTFSVVKNETSPLAANCNPRTKSILRGEQYDCEGPRDEKGHVIEDSVFKLFNDSGGNKKRSSECLNADPSQSEGASKQHSQNHLLVLGDDPKPKRRSLGRNTCSNKKQRPLYNHYENGTGFWEPEREGIDSAEVGSTEMWEGMGSTTTLGGLDELSTFDHL
uniref:Uncharacterized protein n=1 Tax=Chenopodium quinoa TaxID=63459 RepID=A0A803LM44_CHEQI